MPTILRFDGLRVVIYPNDHRPAHVHVVGREAEAVFNLRCPDGPDALREDYGFPRKELAVIGRRLNESLRDACEQWRRIHGAT